MFLRSIRAFKKTIRETCIEAAMRTNLLNRILGRNIWSVYDYMFSPAQLILLTQGLTETRDVSGCCVEIGCAYGRTTAFLRKFMDEQGIAKNYYALDTFNGFVREHLDYETTHRNKGRGVDLWFMNNKKEWFDHALRISGIQGVESIECDAATFDFDGLRPIAFALLDVDLYLPMAAILPKLYQAMSPGGIIFVDDCMPHAYWDGALVAYTEFVAQQGIAPRIEHGKIGIIRKL
jgi:SAM-dependent methyltransferase